MPSPEAQPKTSPEVDAFTFIEQRRAQTTENITETAPRPDSKERLDQLTAKAFDAYFRVLGEVERRKIDDPNDMEFQKFTAGVEDSDPERAHLLRAVRKLIHRDTGLKPSEPKPGPETVGKEREEGPNIAIVEGVYGWASGLAAAKNKFGNEVRYPTAAEAATLLQTLKKDYKNQAVAVFIDESGTYFYLSKSGEQSGKITSDRAPEDTVLLTAVIHDKQERRAA